MSRLSSISRLFLITIAACTGSAVTAQSSNSPEELCNRTNLEATAKIHGYIFKSYSSDSGSCLQVIAENKVIFRRTDDSRTAYTLGQHADSTNNIPAIPNGTDITGRGQPNMIVTFWSGGAHCCLDHYVFELEPKFTFLATIKGRDDDLAHFEDLDRNGNYYYVGGDWTFAYWYGSFAGSPNHEVILRWVDAPDGGSFHLALDKMHKPPPTLAEWQQALQDVRHELHLEQTNYANALPHVLWQQIFDLIYTGHPDLAWKFLDEVGPDAQSSRYHFPDLGDFCSTLKTSYYWPDIAPTLKDAPAKCRNAKPD